MLVSGASRSPSGYHAMMISPNPYVLEAQARVCTGPHQSRPLGLKADDALHADAVLECILSSLAGTLPPGTPPVSTAQLGAFFTAMTLRREFDGAAAYNDAEKRAFAKHHGALLEHLPARVRWLYQPSSSPPPTSGAEAPVIAALRIVLQGKHPSYQQTHRALHAILNDSVSDSLSAALLIGQRMNLESEEETEAYLDAVFGEDDAIPVAVDRLLHIGDPYNGSSRSFRPTLFVAAVHAALGCPTVMHGVDRMPPKLGVTEEQLLEEVGARTDLSLAEAKRHIEDAEAGLAYVSQRVFSPGAYRLAELRVHIKKRPILATTEKAQRLFRSDRENHMVVGYFHPGYEQRLLRLMRKRNINSGLVIKGQEGTSHCSLRQRYRDSEPLMNHCYAYVGDDETTHRAIDPTELDFDYAHHPRIEALNPTLAIQHGMDALNGKRGAAYDSICLSASVQQYLLGFATSLKASRKQVDKMMGNGQALQRLRAYLQATTRA